MCAWGLPPDCRMAGCNLFNVPMIITVIGTFLFEVTS